METYRDHSIIVFGGSVTTRNTRHGQGTEMTGRKVARIRVVTVAEDRVIVSTNRLVASLLEEGILKRDSITVNDRSRFVC